MFACRRKSTHPPKQKKLGWGTRQQRLVSTAQRWIHLAQHGPSQRKKCAGIARRVYIGAVGSQNGHSNVRISYMAASKRSRRAQAPIKILSCAALFVASFVVYWMGISAYEQRLRPSRTEEFDARGGRAFPSESRSTVDPYATSESANIEHPADHGGTNHFWDAIASFVAYCTGPGIGFDGPPSYTEHPAVHPRTSHALDGTPPRFSTLDSYVTPESANIEQPAVQCKAVPCGTSYALDGTSPPLATLDSYATPGFKGIVEEGKRAGEITKAKKEATQSQAAPPRVREASPKAISPPDADLTLADASGADLSDLSDLSVPAFQRPAFQGPTVRVPALQGPAFPVPAFQGPAFPVSAFHGPAFRVPAFQGPAFK